MRISQTNHQTSHVNDTFAKGSFETQDNLFDEFSRTLDMIASKLKKNSENEALPTTTPVESATDRKQVVVKKQKDLESTAAVNAAQTKAPAKANDAADTSEKPAPQAVKAKPASSKKSRKEDPASEADVAAEIPRGHAGEPLAVETAPLTEEEAPLPADETAQLEVMTQAVTGEVPVVVPVTLPTAKETEALVAQTDILPEEVAAAAEEQEAVELPLGEQPTEQFISEQMAPEQVANGAKEAGIDGTKEAYNVEVPELQEQAVVAEAALTAQGTAAVPQEGTDGSLENMILEKLLAKQMVQQVDRAPQKTPEVSQTLLSQSISSNFAALAESVLLQHSNQNIALKMPQNAAESALKQAAQGLQTINPTGMLNGTKSAEIADRRPESKESMKSLPRSSEVKTMERVEAALKEVARSKDGKTISVRLDPPELGTVKIDVSQRDGNIHARLVAESPVVTNLLKERSGEVVQMLRKLGLNVDKVSVSVGNQPEQQPQFHQSMDSHIADRRSENEGGNSSNRRRDRGEQSNGSNKGVQVQHSKLQSVVTDHWVA